MPYERRWLICDGMTGEDAAEEEVEVLSTLGRRSGAECLVEATEIGERCARDREVGAGAERTRQVRVERRVDPVALQVVQAGIHGAGPADLAIEVRLRWGVELSRGDHAGHACDVRGARKAPNQPTKPPRIDDDVIVGERHDAVP